MIRHDDPTLMGRQRRDVLQALCLYGEMDRANLMAAAGYRYRPIDNAILYLRRAGLVVSDFRGQWRATERGKIVNAVLVGQQVNRLTRLRAAIDGARNGAAGAVVGGSPR